MKNLLTALAVIILSCQHSNAQSLKPPAAEKLLHQTFIHNDTLTDYYFWMRDKYSAEVINYLYANNAYSDAVMKESAILQKVLYDEMRARMVETFQSRPAKRKGYYYYSRTIKDKDYPLLFRKKDSLTGPEQLVLDLNKLAEQYLYFSIKIYSISPDQQLLAYGVDSKGNNISKLFVKYINQDSTLHSDTISYVNGFIWCNDNKSFYYTVPEPKTNRAHKLYRHMLGTPVSSDQLVIEEPDPTYQIGLSRSSSEHYIFINISRTKNNEVWHLPASDNQAKPILFSKRKADVLYSLDHFENDEFYVTTNEKALNYRLLKTPILNSDFSKMQTVIPHRPAVLLDGYRLLKNFMIWEERENAQDRVLVKNLTTGYIDTLNPGFDLYNISYSIEDYNYHTSSQIEFSASSEIYPGHTFSYNLETRAQKLIETDSLNEPYKPELYVTKRIYAPSHDGTLVPVTLCYKKGIQLNGNNPVLLSAYGSYGAPSTPGFSSLNISYMNRGFILASAHVRGGSDLGMQWYENGKLLNKKNTFLDFIACAEYLIAQKYTNRNKLAIQGGSAGGLLMGAVCNMRPELFKCVVANVPFVDVMNTMLDESIPLTTFEYEEWGNPRQKKYYDYMRSYSPYDNVASKAYPHILVTTGYNDAQVGYWEPAKWVAKLRELKTDTNLVLFKVNMEGGHGGASGRYAQLKERAYEQAFIMKHLGVKENYLDLKGKIIDANGNPVDYANIYIEGSGVGTNSNGDGEFSLRLKNTDNIYIVVQSIGFEKQRIRIDMNTRTRDLVVKLRSDNVLLSTALITKDGKDPAIGIMKKAIKMRKANFDKVQGFAADVYMKSNVRLDEIPKKIPKFLTIAANGEKIDSNDIGLVYLSESVARYNFEKPDNVKETMIASRVAGQKQGFSFNRVEDVFINFYEPTVKIGYYSERPFVSPVAPLAMLSYKYKYKGTIAVDGHDVYKIEVIPARKGDPLFHGIIYISNNDYQIYGIDMYITKDAQIEFVDTLFLQQEMVNENNIYMPIQLKLYSHIKVFGFRATDLSVAAMSNYKVNTPFSKSFFSYEVFNIEKGANKKDTLYWNNNRTVVLTEEEDKHYRKSDSIYLAQNTPAYLDSMDRVRNRFKWHKLLIGGYTYSKRNDSLSRTFSMSALPFTFGYNTVEGLFMNYRLSWSKYNYTTREFRRITPMIRYGFMNKNLAPSLSYVKSIQPKTSTYISVAAGRFILQYNDAGPINTFLNTAYTLIDRLNYAKFLQKDAASITINRELVNGLYSSLNLQWHNRQALTNHANFAFINEDKRSFSSNNPLNPSNDAIAFATHQTFEYKIAARYVPRQRYENYPEYKRILGSRYPDIYASFKHGFALSGASFNYQLLEAGTGKELDLKLLGSFTFDVTAGIFFNTSGMIFADYKHFNGNLTMVLNNPENRNAIGDYSRERLTAFHALDYYSLSTNRHFIEAHLMQDFRSFFIGKLPLLRKTRAHEIAGINYLQTSSTTYTEAYIGLANIFSILRVDAGRVISNTTNNNWFFRFGLGFNF